MGGKYEIRYYSNTDLAKQLNNGIETRYTSNWFEFIWVRLTRKVIYYKVYCE